MKQNPKASWENVFYNEIQRQPFLILGGNEDGTQLGLTAQLAVYFIIPGK